MRKKIIYTVVILAAVFVLALAVRFVFGGPEDDWICQDNIWVKHGNPSASQPIIPCGNQTKTEPLVYKDLIKIDSPVQGQKISSPVSVKGEARGNWYFEASFPVQVLDGDRTLLGSSPIQAQGDWMTTDFVPFSGSIEFTKPKSKIGTIIFKKDNPSGLPSNDDSVSIPINF